MNTDALAPLRRPPLSLAIVASETLAVSLARRGGRVDGFVVEGPTAGGHNAPPRGLLTLNDADEPAYGPRDVVDLRRMRDIGLPFCPNAVLMRFAADELPRSRSARLLDLGCGAGRNAGPLARVRGAAAVFPDGH